MFIKEKYNDINKNEKTKKINLCTLNVEEYTKGLRFPATKNDLSEKIKQHNAPKNVIELIALFQEKLYESSVDIEREELKSKNILTSLSGIKFSLVAQSEN